MKTTMQILLDAVEWKPVESPFPKPVANPDGVPVATHEGVLDLFGMQVKVYQLNDGQRVVQMEDMEKIFGTISDQT